MKKDDATRIFRVSPEVERNELVEAQAADAFRELWASVVENAGADPRSRLVTPTMVKDAIEARLRDVLPRGSLTPRVLVRLNAERTGFDVEISPARVSRR